MTVHGLMTLPPALDALQGLLNEQRSVDQLPLDALVTYAVALQTLTVAFGTAQERLCRELARRGVEMKMVTYTI
ncbi:MAG: hypothetical protein KatS3mg109_0391 [Pirellulaceae bacterium]|nr:MAG: hypothetical protein KatS3mg109_0391 [Pirellulaceae bacterium]